MPAIINKIANSLLFVMILAMPIVSSANDGFGELGMGGIYLSQTDDIAMRHEVLDISYSEIQVAYEFQNESDHDVTSIISFPLPLYAAFPSQSGVIAKGQPTDFSVVVDNKPVHYTTKVQAISQGNDITSQLHSLGFSDHDIAQMPFAIDKILTQRNPYKGVMSEKQISSLTNLGLITDELPNWNIQVTYQWTQKFPAHAKLSISHKYKPFVAEGTASGYDSKDFVTRFCIDPQSKNKLDYFTSRKENLNPYGQLSGSVVAYVLKTANTWKNGIEDFTLRLHKDSPTEIISLCFSGQFRKLDPLTIETHLKNFKPTTDLDIYIANIKQQISRPNYGEAPTIN